MQGEINVAAIMALEAIKQQRTKVLLYPPTTLIPAKPFAIDPQLRKEWDEEHRRRQHLQRVHRAWVDWGIAGGDEVAQAEARREWGEILEEALERRRVYKRWLKKVHMPKVAALRQRMVALQEA